MGLCLICGTICQGGQTNQQPNHRPKTTPKPIPTKNQPKRYQKPYPIQTHQMYPKSNIIKTILSLFNVMFNSKLNHINTKWVGGWGRLPNQTHLSRCSGVGCSICSYPPIHIGSSNILGLTGYNLCSICICSHLCNASNRNHLGKAV